MAIRDLIRRRGSEDLPERRGESSDLFSLQREMNRLFDDFFSDFGLRPFWGQRGDEAALERAFTPRVNVSETDKEIKISAELPGMEEKDVNVELTDDVLTIRGEKKEEQEDKGKNWYSMERSYGSFSRTIPLPCPIQEDKAQAKFKKGVLNVTLPKAEEEQAKKKKIDIKSE